MRERGSIEVTKAIRNTWSTTGYTDIAGYILGSHYDLSIVLIGDTRARSLNQKYRHKDGASNVLTFPLAKNTGEIFINIARVKREAKSFGLSPHGHAKFLLIHACLHLKGYSHGSTMEEAENKLLTKFRIR